MRSSSSSSASTPYDQPGPSPYYTVTAMGLSLKRLGDLLKECRGDVCLTFEQTLGKTFTVSHERLALMGRVRGRRDYYVATTGS